MDTGRGNFAEISEQRYRELAKDNPNSRAFRIDEIVELKGSKFKVTAIEKRGRLKLKLLHDDEVLLKRELWEEISEAELSK